MLTRADARDVRSVARVANIPFRWRRAICASELPPTSRLVAHVLATHMNTSGGSCFPGMATIARESGLGRRTVIRAVKDLEERGYVTVVERGGTTREGRARSNSYEARFPAPGATVAPVSEMHRCHRDTDPVSEMHPPGVAAAPEVVMKLDIEQQWSQATKPKPHGEEELGWGSTVNEDGLRRIERQLAEIGRSTDDE